MAGEEDGGGGGGGGGDETATLRNKEMKRKAKCRSFIRLSGSICTSGSNTPSAKSPLQREPNNAIVLLLLPLPAGCRFRRPSERPMDGRPAGRPAGRSERRRRWYFGVRLV